MKFEPPDQSKAHTITDTLIGLTAPLPEVAEWMTISGDSKNGGGALNLRAVPSRREKPCVIIHWLVFPTGWQQKVNS